MARLLLPAECDELTTLSLRVLQRVERDAHLTDPHSLGPVVDAIANAVRASLVIRLRSYPSQHRLPTELWHIVWENLSQYDCIIVSHVCHDWRTAVLARARLWTNVELVSTAHGPACNCLTCRSRTKPCASCQRPPKPPVDTFERTRTMVYRSGGLPLDLSVVMEAPKLMGLPQWPDLWQLIQSHVHRIRLLDLKLSDMFACRFIVQSFNSAKALEVLSIHNRAVDSNVPVNTRLEVTSTVLPNLKILRIISGITYSQSELPHCPLAHEVDAIFNDVSDISALLRAAPRVQTLHLRYSFNLPFHQPDSALREDVRDAMRRANTQRLCILHSPPWILSFLLANFDLSALAHIEVGCENLFELARDGHFTSLIRSLSDAPVQLEWLLEPVGRIVAWSASGHSRTINFRSISTSETCNALIHVWCVLSAHDIHETMRRLHVDFILWPAIFQSAHASRAWNIRELTIDAFSDQSSLLGWAELAELAPGAVPYLEKLHLRAKGVAFPLRALVQAWENMGLAASGQRLKMLTLEGVDMDISDVAAALPVDEIVRMPFQHC